MREGKKFLRAYIGLYQDLLNRYYKLNRQDDYFEMDFIWDDAWIPRFIKNESTKSLVNTYEGVVIDFALEKLCKMESELLKYEKSIAKSKSCFA
jgi:hypothetical protein